MDKELLRRMHPSWATCGAQLVFGDVTLWGQLAKARAWTLPVYDGDIERNQWIVARGTWLLTKHSAIAIVTRDNLVKLGFWKNIEYQNCLHLSISFRDLRTTQSADFDNKAAAEIVAATFRDFAQYTWWEPPYSPEGKARGVQHWRLFFAPDWLTPIHPRGEPHTLNVPAGWQGWTGYQEAQPTPNFNADITDELPKRREHTDG